MSDITLVRAASFPAALAMIATNHTDQIIVQQVTRCADGLTAVSWHCHVVIPEFLTSAFIVPLADTEERLAGLQCLG
jgi:hypothetical protein